MVFQPRILYPTKMIVWEQNKVVRNARVLIILPGLELPPSGQNEEISPEWRKRCLKMVPNTWKSDKRSCQDGRKGVAVPLAPRAACPGWSWKLHALQGWSPGKKTERMRYLIHLTCVENTIEKLWENMGKVSKWKGGHRYCYRNRKTLWVNKASTWPSKEQYLYSGTNVNTECCFYQNLSFWKDRGRGGKVLIFQSKK